MSSWEILEGDAMERLREQEAERFHCVVTSPPYWGLRDYGEPGQLGQEETPQGYVAALVRVFDEVRRVLRDDGTLWLNIGDTYAGKEVSTLGEAPKASLRGGRAYDADADHVAERNRGTRNTVAGGLKAKDLAMIPARLAIAMQEAGWYLRAEIVWAKPNAMPESVQDRPTRNHEMVYLLTKSPAYFYDATAVAEPAVSSRGSGNGFARPEQVRKGGIGQDGRWPPTDTRNRRGVWTIPTRPFKAAHFATFPRELPRLCIEAGTSEKGCCCRCGAPLVRVTEKVRENASNAAKAGTVIEGKGHPSGQVRDGHDIRNGPKVSVVTIGWEPSCGCGADSVPCRVLDPFVGAGTTGLEALRLGRSFLGIELVPKYAKMARRRIIADAPLLNTAGME